MPILPFLLPSLIPFLLMYMVPCCKNVCARRTLINTFSILDPCLRAAIAAPPTFRSPDLHLELLGDPPGRRTSTLPIYFPSKFSPIYLLQCHLHLDRVSRLVWGFTLFTRLYLLNRVYPQSCKIPKSGCTRSSQL
jgi:hypothetical protein